MAIGRDEDTIIRWRKEDPVFAEAVLRAKASWVRKRLLATKAEFALERLAKEVFSQHNTIELEEISKEKTGHDFLREIAETIREANKGRPPNVPPIESLGSDR